MGHTSTQGNCAASPSPVAYKAPGTAPTRQRPGPCLAPYFPATLGPRYTAGTMRTIFLVSVVLALGCGSSSQSKQDSCSAGEPGCPGETPAPASGPDGMWHHFWDVAEARDAVIGGELEGVKAPLLRLAESELPGGPGDAAMTELKAHAKQGTEAVSLAQAALSVAQVAGQCAACHESTQGGPRLDGDVQGYRSAQSTGLGEAMLRHVWSAEELWLGLTVPNDAAWARGAKALAETALPSEKPADQAAATKLDQKLAAVWELGARAEQASSRGERVALFGELIAACGDCHLSMNVKVEPLLGGPQAE